MNMYQFCDEGGSSAAGSARAAPGSVRCGRRARPSQLCLRTCERVHPVSPATTQGVVSALEEMGVLRRPHPLAGASAGSLVAAAYNTGLDM